MGRRARSGAVGGTYRSSLVAAAVTKKRFSVTFCGSGAGIYTYHTKITCEASRPKRGSHTESRASLAPRRPLGPIIHHSGGIGVIFDNLQYFDISADFFDCCRCPLAMPLTSQHVPEGSGSNLKK